jgi:hypothetical protein
MIRIWTIHGPLSACYRVNYNSDDIVTWTISALFMFGIIGIPGRRPLSALAPWSWSRPVTVSPPRTLSVTLPSHINQSQGQPLLCFGACRLRALRGHQGYHHPPASCLGRGRVQNLGGHVFTFCYPIPHHFSLYLHTCTLIRGMLPDVLNLFMGMIEVPPGLPSHSDRPNFPSQFYFPISTFTPASR